MTEIVFSVRDAPEGGFVAEAAGASIVTEGDTVEHLRENVREAVRCHFDPGTEPTTIRLLFVHEEVIVA